MRQRHKVNEKKINSVDKLVPSECFFWVPHPKDSNGHAAKFTWIVLSVFFLNVCTSTFSWNGAAQYDQNTWIKKTFFFKCQTWMVQWRKKNDTHKKKNRNSESVHTKNKNKRKFIINDFLGIENEYNGQTMLKSLLKKHEQTKKSRQIDQ